MYALALCSRYEGEAEDLGISFCVEEDTFGRRTVHELRPGGADVAVTNTNKLLYVHLVADWHLNGRLGKAAAAFAAGLHQVTFLSILFAALITLEQMLQHPNQHHHTD